MISAVLLVVLHLTIWCVQSQALGERLKLLKTGEVFKGYIENADITTKFLVIGGWFRWSNCEVSQKQYIITHNWHTRFDPGNSGGDNNMLKMLFTSGSTYSYNRPLDCEEWVAFAYVIEPDGTHVGELSHPLLLNDSIDPNAHKSINLTQVDSTHGYFKWHQNLQLYNLFYYIDYTGSITGTNGLAQSFSDIVFLPSRRDHLISANLFKIWIDDLALNELGWKRRSDILDKVFDNGLLLEDGVEIMVRYFEVAWTSRDNGFVPESCTTYTTTIIRVPFGVGEADVDVTMGLLSWLNSSQEYLVKYKYSYDVTTSTSTLRILNGNGVLAAIVDKVVAEPVRIDIVHKVCIFPLSNGKSNVTSSAKMFINGGNGVETVPTRLGFNFQLVPYDELKWSFIKETTIPLNSTYYVYQMQAIYGGMDWYTLSNTDVTAITDCLVKMVHQDYTVPAGFNPRCYLCGPGFYLADGQCRAHATNVSCTTYYNSTNCSHCDPASFYYNKINHYCIPRTPACTFPLVYEAPNYCSDPAATSCNEYQTYINGSCKCNIAYCDKCTGNICQRCDAGYHLVYDLTGAKACSLNIPAGYGIDHFEVNPSVRPCAMAGCLNCSTDYIECDECDPSSVGTFCRHNKLCHASCDKCENSDPNICISCLTPTDRIQLNGTCGPCDTANKFFDNSTHCLQCSGFCQTCNGTTASNCLTCVINRYLQGGNTCVSCTISSKTKNGQFCYNCEDPCQTCSLLPTNCTSCKNSEYLYENNNTCTPCIGIQGYYQTVLSRDIGPTNICNPCDPQCLTCSTNSQTCTSCDTSVGLYLFPNNTCNPCNFVGFFLNGNDCLECDTSCLSCEKSATSCTQCHNGDFLFPQDNNRCDKCPHKRYYKVDESSMIPKCLQCMPNCEICSSATTCNSCASGFYMYPNQTCGLCSESNYVKAGSYCLPCYNTCLTCSGTAETQCTSCIEYHILKQTGKCMLKGQLRIIKAQFASEVQQVWISFDQNIMSVIGEISDSTEVALLRDKKEIVDSKLAPLMNSNIGLSTIQGIQKVQSFSIKSIGIEKNTIKVSLRIKETVNSGTFVLLFSSTPALCALTNSDTIFLERAITVTPVDIVLTGFDEMIESAAGPTSAALSTATILLLLISLPQAFILMKVFQTVDYYIFIDGEYPVNYSRFLQMMSNNIMDYIPNMFEDFSDTEGSHLPERLEQFGVNIHILDNLGQYFTMVCGLLGIKILLKLIELALTKIWMKGAAKATELYKFVGPELLFGTLEAFHLDIILGITVHVAYRDRVKSVGLDGKYIAIVFVSFLSICLVSLYLYMAYTVSRLSISYKEHFGLPVKDMKDESFRFWLADKNPHGGKFQRHFNLVMLFRDLVNCMLLLIFYHKPLTMVIIMTVLQGVFCLMLTTYHPFELKWMNTSSMLTHYSYLSLDILYIINLSSPDLKSETRYNLIGYPMILVVLSIIAVNVSMATYYSIKNSWNKWKKKKQKTTKVGDVNDKTFDSGKDEISIHSSIQNIKEFSTTQEISQKAIKEYKLENKQVIDESSPDSTFEASGERITVKSSKISRMLKPRTNLGVPQKTEKKISELAQTRNLMKFIKGKNKKTSDSKIL